MGFFALKGFNFRTVLENGGASEPTGLKGVDDNV